MRGGRGLPVRSRAGSCISWSRRVRGNVVRKFSYKKAWTTSACRAGAFVEALIEREEMASSASGGKFYGRHQFATGEGLREVNPKVPATRKLSASV